MSCWGSGSDDMTFGGMDNCNYIQDTTTVTEQPDHSYWVPPGDTDDQGEASVTVSCSCNND